MFSQLLSSGELKLQNDSHRTGCYSELPNDRVHSTDQIFYCAELKEWKQMILIIYPETPVKTGFGLQSGNGPILKRAGLKS